VRVLVFVNRVDSDLQVVQLLQSMITMAIFLAMAIV